MKPGNKQTVGTSISRAEQIRQSERSGKESSFIFFEQMHDPQPMPHQGVYLASGVKAVTPPGGSAARLAAQVPVLIAVRRDERNPDRQLQQTQRTKRS